MFHLNDLRLFRFSALIAASVAAGFSSASAQEFRVVTTVFQDGQSTPISRSLTMFRAGKVYDYVDAADEVIIYEPARDQFLILNPRHNLATTVEQEQIRQRLSQVRAETRKYAEELTSNPAPTVRRQISLLSFQLGPEFAEQFDPATGRLQLKSDRIGYTIVGRQLDQHDLTTAYLDYTDWICRLNFLLHPTPLLPDVRLKVNEALRRYDLFPLQVELDADLDQPLLLSADHSIEHGLGSSDRSMIHQWELLLNSPKIRRVAFREYQQRTLGAKERAEN